MRKLLVASAWLAQLTSVGALALVATPAIAAVPVPLHVLPITDGVGHIAAGSTGTVASPAALLRVALEDARNTFGGTLSVRSATRSNDGTLTLASVHGNPSGTPTDGIVVAEFAPRGASRVWIVYDRSDRFATTARDLLARATASPDKPAGPVEPMRERTAPDGSVRASVPDNWKISIFSQGAFSAMGPAGEEVDQEVAAHLIEPSSAVLHQALQLQRQLNQPSNPLNTPYGIPLVYDPDPVHAYVAFVKTIANAQRLQDPKISIERTIPQPVQGDLRIAEIIGTDNVKGIRMRFDGIVAVGPESTIGTWMLSVKMVTAPVATFERALPTLAAIYNSYRIDQNIRQAQVRRTLAEDKAGAARGLALMRQTQAHDDATFSASMSHAHAVQEVIDRSTAGFTRYLSGTTVVQNEATGVRRTVGESFADTVVKNDPQHFSIVPVSEYRKGSEF